MGGLPGALEAAKANCATDRVVDVLRAAVSAGTTTDATWAAPLVAYQAISAGFLESLKSASAFQAILSAGAFRVVRFVRGLGIVASGAVATRVAELFPTLVSRLSIEG